MSWHAKHHNYYQILINFEETKDDRTPASAADLQICKHQNKKVQIIIKMHQRDPQTHGGPRESIYGSHILPVYSRNNFYHAWASSQASIHVSTPNSRIQLKHLTSDTVCSVGDMIPIGLTITVAISKQTTMTTTSTSAEEHGSWVASVGGRNAVWRVKRREISLHLRVFV